MNTTSGRIADTFEKLRERSKSLDEPVIDVAPVLDSDPGA